MSNEPIHAAVLHGPGQTPRYEPFPAPVAADGDVVVNVTAAALKPSDRSMAKGRHYAPAGFPVVAGLDGVGRLDDGTRVAFFLPQRPYGGMAEQALVRRGIWLPVPDGVDDVLAAACLNPGMAAWKTVVWEGDLEAGETVLILGATGTSGRIAAQLALRRGARVVVAGRNQCVLDVLLARGAAAAIRVDRPHDELTAAIAAAGPYDLIIDYPWGAPAEAAFAAQITTPAARRTRYIQVGIAAGDAAILPAMTLRAAPVELFGSGIGGQAAPEAGGGVSRPARAGRARRDRARRRRRTARRGRGRVAASRERTACGLRPLSRPPCRSAGSSCGSARRPQSMTSRSTSARRGLRTAGAERRRQDDHHASDDHAAAADDRRGGGVRARRPRAPDAGPPPARFRPPAALRPRLADGGARTSPSSPACSTCRDADAGRWCRRCWPLSASPTQPIGSWRRTRAA